MTDSAPITFLAVSSFFKGTRFLEELKRQGCRTLLLTIEKRLADPWPRDSIDEILALPDFHDRRHVFNAVSYLARTEKIVRMAPLDDFDVELVAALREHLRMPGMGDTTARHFRDKLAMRVRGQECGIPIPRFVHVLHHETVQKFLDEVPPPWMLKPRSSASAIGIRKLTSQEEAWKAIHSLGDEQSYHLIEEMLDGDLYHVDSIVWDGKVIFAEPHHYRTPLFEVSHEGGVFASRTMKRDDPKTLRLLERNRELVTELRFVRGVLHTEFFERRSDGEFYFIETASRVGGANIADLVEGSTGVNLWEEWAKIEISQGATEYELRDHGNRYAGIVVSLTREENPDDSEFNDPEIVWRLRDKKHHIGFVVASDDHQRVHDLVEDYVARVARDYQAVLPVPKKAIE